MAARVKSGTWNLRHLGDIPKKMNVKFNVPELSSLICPDSQHTVQQQKTFRIQTFESKCSYAFRCVLEWSRCTAIHRSSFGLWNNAALCLHLRNPSWFSTDHVHIVKLPDVRSILICVHALDESVNFVLTIFLSMLLRRIHI